MEENEIIEELQQEFTVYYIDSELGFQSIVVEGENLEHALCLFLMNNTFEECLGIMKK